MKKTSRSASRSRSEIVLLDQADLVPCVRKMLRRGSSADTATNDQHIKMLTIEIRKRCPQEFFLRYGRNYEIARSSSRTVWSQRRSSSMAKYITYLRVHTDIRGRRPHPQQQVAHSGSPAPMHNK